jgi:nucleoside-diphosphate kinase
MPPENTGEAGAHGPVAERTLVLVKPDAVCRGLTGQILARFETAGLKIVGLKMVRPSRDFVERHYPNTPEWIRGMGEKTLDSYRDRGIDPVAEVGTDDPLAIGEIIRGWNIDYLTSGPIVAVIFEGLHAIATVRKLCGNTLPFKAEPGTIRGTYSSSSPLIANSMRRAIYNLVHASSNPEEVAHETAHWFGPEEPCPYRRTDEEALY